MPFGFINCNIVFRKPIDKISYWSFIEFSIILVNAICARSPSAGTPLRNVQVVKFENLFVHAAARVAGRTARQTIKAKIVTS